jgi:seryl-tRNA synthetase
MIEEIKQNIVNDNKYSRLIDYIETLEQAYDKRVKLLNQLEEENKQLKRQLSLLCPIADLPVIESLMTEKQMYMEQIKEYEDALREIDVHIRATPEPVPYIIDILKKVLPEYK